MKPKSLKEFVREGQDGEHLTFVSLVDPLGDKSYDIFIFKDSLGIEKDKICSWIDRYEQYLSSLIDPLTHSVFRIDSFLNKYRDFDESKQRRTYVIRNRETDTFLHSNGLEYGLTHDRDGLPTGLYETREAAEEVIKKYWRNYKVI